jgi:hypothetical protein
LWIPPASRQLVETGVSVGTVGDGGRGLGGRRTGHVYDSPLPIRKLRADIYCFRVTVEASTCTRAIPARFTTRPRSLKKVLTPLHEAWWTLNEYLPDEPFAAVSFMLFLPREEVIAAARAPDWPDRGCQPWARGQGGRADGNRRVPEHKVETLRLGVARLEGELVWARTLLERMRDGH